MWKEIAICMLIITALAITSAIVSFCANVVRKALRSDTPPHHCGCQAKFAATNAPLPNTGQTEWVCRECGNHLFLAHDAQGAILIECKYCRWQIFRLAVGRESKALTEEILVNGLWKRATETEQKEYACSMQTLTSSPDACEAEGKSNCSSPPHRPGPAFGNQVL
jgi:DNA-directed RNA polymerase subunit RPC12/RpoP